MIVDSSRERPSTANARGAQRGRFVRIETSTHPWLTVRTVPRLRPMECSRNAVTMTFPHAIFLSNPKTSFVDMHTIPPFVPTADDSKSSDASYSSSSSDEEITDDEEEDEARVRYDPTITKQARADALLELATTAVRHTQPIPQYNPLADPDAEGSVVITPSIGRFSLMPLSGAPAWCGPQYLIPKELHLFLLKLNPVMAHARATWGQATMLCTPLQSYDGIAPMGCFNYIHAIGTLHAVAAAPHGTWETARRILRLDAVMEDLRACAADAHRRIHSVDPSEEGDPLAIAMGIVEDLWNTATGFPSPEADFEALIAKSFDEWACFMVTSPDIYGDAGVHIDAGGGPWHGNSLESPMAPSWRAILTYDDHAWTSKAMVVLPDPSTNGPWTPDELRPLWHAVLVAYGLQYDDVTTLDGSKTPWHKLEQDPVMAPLTIPSPRAVCGPISGTFSKQLGSIPLSPAFPIRPHVSISGPSFAAIVGRVLSLATEKSCRLRGHLFQVNPVVHALWSHYGIPLRDLFAASQCMPKKMVF